jgi:hypothetical protein
MLHLEVEVKCRDSGAFIRGRTLREVHNTQGKISFAPLNPELTARDRIAII